MKDTSRLNYCSYFSTERLEIELYLDLCLNKTNQEQDQPKISLISIEKIEEASEKP